MTVMTQQPAINQAKLAKHEKTPPAGFVPLDQEQRSHVGTAVMCHHLNRQEQTARHWASTETYPPGLKPLRVMNRLAWPVAGIKAILEVA